MRPPCGLSPPGSQQSPDGVGEHDLDTVAVSAGAQVLELVVDHIGGVVHKYSPDGDRLNDSGAE